jgi:hypothetical protein
VLVFLYVHRVRSDGSAEAGRLLRVLFLRLGSMSADSGRALGPDGRAALLRRMIVVASDIARTSRDWLRSPRARALAWWVPQGAIVVSLILAVPLRTVIWIAALIWMGMACILNAKQCGRTHCRYTGPYYLAMTVPVLALGTGIFDADLLGWSMLGAIILVGSKLIWWATERAWGKFS